MQIISNTITMLTTVVRLPVTTFRKLLPSQSHDKVMGIYSIIANVKDIAHQLDAWRMRHPFDLADVDVSTEPARAIRQTLIDKPKEFKYRNRGLTLLAHRASYDNRERIALIEFSDPKLHGLVEGGPTYKVICNYMDELSESDRQHYIAYIHLEVYAGIFDAEFVEKLVEARHAYGTPC